MTSFDGKVFHMVDALWCDTHGVFVKGWAHALDVPIKTIHLSSGSSRTQVTDFSDRVDLLSFFPTLFSTRCGFHVYLACTPFRPVTLEIETSSGLAAIDITALSPEHPSNASRPEPVLPLPRFASEMKRIAGTVVEIGSRVVGPLSSLQADIFRPECKFIGVDIHEAPGVDIVADAHFLSDHIAPGSIDGIFSLAVIEHLACPWLLAAQINKLLKPGGLTLHSVPHSFPIHEMPNDFWRMSSEGLKILFSPEMGFEVLETDMGVPVKMIAHPNFRQGPMLEFPLHDGMAMSYVLARKTFDLSDGAVAWPLQRGQSTLQSKSYPDTVKANATATAHAGKSAFFEGTDKHSATADVGGMLKFDGSDAPTEKFVCRACGDDRTKARVLTAPDTQRQSGRRYQLFRCSECLSLVYHPFPEIDYRQHTGGLALRDYLEMNASIDTVARNLFRVIPASQPGRLLDVGCGFGFALDVVRSISRWGVKGFEPSQYGMMGRDQLKLDIVSDFAQMNRDFADRYDIVHCSEVIEHVHDASAFLDILTSYLSPRGVLVLTTPNPERISHGTNESTLLALLSPGSHTILFSDEALTRLLKLAGLVHVSVDKTSNSTLFYASREPIDFQPVDLLPSTFLLYLQGALDRAEPGSSLEIGLRYRLFRSAADLGKYELADQTFVPSLADADPGLNDVRSLEDFADKWPLCIAASTYYRGMMLLIHKSDYADAAIHFRAAYRLCRAKLDLAPSISLVEADLIWRAVYHKALAEKYLGSFRKAAETLSAFKSDRLTPPVPQDLRPAINTLRSSLD